MEFGKIISGATRVKCNVYEFPKYIDIVFAETCPDGYLPVEKVLPKPEVPDGKWLAFVYTNTGTALRKEYFLVDAGESAFEAVRKFSKLKIYGAITQLGAWGQVQSWLETKDVGGLNGWMAFQLAQEISEDHPMFAPLSEDARVMLGLTKEQFDSLLAQCVLDE